MNISQDGDLANLTKAQDVEVVVHVGLGNQPEIFLEDGVAKPDRHFLIGLIQLCTVAVEERDAEVVLFSPDTNVVLEVNGHKNTISSGVLIFKTRKGRVGCVCLDDAGAGRRIMRDALRRFTGTIRLDIP